MTVHGFEQKMNLGWPANGADDPWTSQLVAVPCTFLLQRIRNLHQGYCILSDPAAFFFGHPALHP